MTMPHINHGTPSAYMTHKCRCDECKAWKKAKDAAYYARHRDRVKARANAYYAENKPAVRAAQNARKAARTVEQRAADKEQAQQYYAEPEARAKRYARARKYSQTPAGKAVHRAAAHRRRGVPFTAEGCEYIEIIRHDPCCYCGGAGGEIDHIVAVVEGGTGDWDNLTAACRSCNAQKHDNSVLEFLLRRAA